VQTAALALAERITGVHLDPSVLECPLAAAQIAPLLNDPPASFSPGRRGRGVGRGHRPGRAGRAAQSAATAARQAVRLAQLDHDPVVADPRTALSATLERVRHLPGDPWMAIRAAALGVLRLAGGGAPVGAR
jgi:hypothetical protein